MPAMHIPLTLMAALLAVAPAPPAAPAAPRSPRAAWVVDFADHQCLASRDYGAPDAPLFLALKPSPVGSIVQIILVLKTAHAAAPAEAPVAIRIDGRAPIAASLLAFKGKTPDLRQFQINLPNVDFEGFRRASTVTFQSRELNESFTLAQMPELMAQMERCVVDLQHHWNMPADPPLRSRAMANLREIVRPEDYPGIAIDKEEGGLVRFGLLIDETGRVADCVVTETSRVPTLDAQACALIKLRARFKPAIGADGKPARDSINSSVTWRISG